MKKQLLFTTLTMVAIGGSLHANQDNPKNTDANEVEKVEKKVEVTKENKKRALAKAMVAELDKNRKVNIGEEKEEKEETTKDTE